MLDPPQSCGQLAIVSPVSHTPLSQTELLLMQVPFWHVWLAEHFEELSTQAFPAELHTLQPLIFPGVQIVVLVVLSLQIPFMQV